MGIPLLSGAGAKGAEWIDLHPLNLEPIVTDSGISKGQLRHPAGASVYATGPGVDRGGINWNGTHLRVMGTKLVRVNVDATVDVLGDVGGSGPVTMDYSFDRLGIRSGTALYYWDGLTLTLVTDVDLGPVLDFIWIAGFFMTTDGTSIVVTELADPTSVLPLKYGSAEADPDPVTGILKNRQTNEAIILGRYTIQVLQNVGGNGFPYAPVAGATLPYGCVSASAKCYMGQGYAFVGSGRGDALGVYLAAGQGVLKISSRALDDALAAEEDPTAIVLERRASRDEQNLMVHLAGETWGYGVNVSATSGEPVWYRLRSGIGKAYRLRHPVLMGSDCYVGDTESGAIGLLNDDLDSHFGEETEWQFDPGLIYNKGRAAILHELELVGLPGRGSAPGSFFMSMTRDGETFTSERPMTVYPGERGKRLHWRPHSRFQTQLGLRFRGIGGRPGFAALEATVQAL